MTIAELITILKKMPNKSIHVHAWFDEGEIHPVNWAGQIFVDTDKGETEIILLSNRPPTQ